MDQLNSLVIIRIILIMICVTDTKLQCTVMSKKGKFSLSLFSVFSLHPYRLNSVFRPMAKAPIPIVGPALFFLLFFFFSACRLSGWRRPLPVWLVQTGSLIPCGGGFYSYIGADFWLRGWSFLSFASPALDYSMLYGIWVGSIRKAWCLKLVYRMRSRHFVDGCSPRTGVG